MASTKSQSKSSSNGAGPAVGSAVKGVGDTATAAARRARRPMLAAGAAAAGLAGGLAAGSRRGSKRRGRIGLLDRRPRVLGVPIGPKSGALKAAELLRDGAKHLDSASRQVSGATNEVRELNDQLDRLNRRSPLEVVLDGLTHRRGAHKREG
jgi:hypothetical protein